MNRKLLIIAGLILVVLVIGIKTEPQTVAPGCFEESDCIAPVQEGYCEVRYDCIVGKCYSEQIRCPEVCYGWKDEDFDGLIDCKDQDCYNSPHCPCEQASFNRCSKGSCYCSSGSPRWFVSDVGHWCQCN